MRILIDECLPRQLKGWLAGRHDALTVQDMGWANIKNGKLLQLAEKAGFDVFVTADKNIYHQQNFTGLRLSTIVIPSNRKRRVQESVPAFLQSLENVQPGQKVVMDLGSSGDAWQSLRLHAIEQDENQIIHVFR